MARGKKNAPSPAVIGSACAQVQDQADGTDQAEIEISRLTSLVRSLQICDEDAKDALADYVGILKRELIYHQLRADELKRDLRNNGIEV